MKRHSMLITAGLCLFIVGCEKKPSSEPTGVVSFWSDFDSCKEKEVKVNGSFIGDVSDYFTSEPECNEVGTLTIELRYGSYSYEAKDTCYTWNGTFTVNSDCLLIPLKKQ